MRDVAIHQWMSPLLVHIYSSNRLTILIRDADAPFGNDDRFIRNEKQHTKDCNGQHNKAPASRLIGHEPPLYFS